MPAYRPEGHSLHNITLHFVWTTRNRQRCLTGSLAKRVHELLRITCEKYKVDIKGGRVKGNYVHMILSCPSDLSPSNLAQYLKGRSSYHIRQEYPQFKNQYSGDGFWDRGYFCASVGEDVSEETIMKYVKGELGQDET